MEAILASKLYKCSKRKDKIHSALEDPVNLELVEQLKEYLDPEYLQPDNDDVFDEPSGTKTVSKDSEYTPPAPPSGPSFASSPSAPPTLEGEEFTEEDADDFDDSAETDVDLDDTGDVDAEGEGDLAEATKVPETKQSVTASTDLKCVVEELKGLLNARDDTCGVSRISVRDTELWIHYNDSISLNNVMDKVIDLVYVSGYSYLYFDRLARSENAIVFQIIPASTNEDKADSDEKQK